MKPTGLLSISVGLLVVPAIYMLVAVLLAQQGALGAAPISARTLALLWCAGLACLLVPLAFPRGLASLARSTRLVLAVVVSVGATFFGLVLTFATGRLAPLWLLGAGSMLAILTWSFAFRDCLRAEPLARIVSRYTTALFALAALSLISAAVRALRWDPTASDLDLASSAFLIFGDACVAIAASCTARLRQRGSPYARPATTVLSWALLGVPVLGTAVGVYWLVAVRRQERDSAAQSAGQPTR